MRAEMSSLYAHFIPSVAQKYWKLFLGNPRQVGPYLGDRVPEQFLHLLLGQAHDLHLRHPSHFPADHLGLGRRLPGPPLLADREGGNQTRLIAFLALKSPL